jgi:hypothetical protein
MQNREELRQKGHDGSHVINDVLLEGEKISFSEGEGGDIVSDRNIDPRKLVRNTKICSFLIYCQNICGESFNAKYIPV